MNLAEHLKARAALGWKGLPIALALAGTLGVTGNTTLGGTLGVTGNTTLGGTLGVTGNTTLGGTLTVGGALPANESARMFASGPTAGSTRNYSLYVAGGGITRIDGDVHHVHPNSGAGGNISHYFMASDYASPLGYIRNAYAIEVGAQWHTTIHGYHGVVLRDNAGVIASFSSTGIATMNGGAHAWSISGAERMRLSADGFLKVANDGTYYGTSTAMHELNNSAANQYVTVIAHRAVANPHGLWLYFANTTPNDAASNFIACTDSGGNARMRVYANGGIANFSANNVNLSDTTRKTGRKAITGNWNKIVAVRNAIEEFQYTEDVAQQGTAARKNIGPSAQVVATEFPEFVTNWSEPTELNPDAPLLLGVRELPLLWMMMAQIVDTIEAVRKLPRP